MKKLGAALCFAGVFGLVAAAVRREPDLLPSVVRQGQLAPAVLQAVVQASDSAVRSVDVIFVSRDCGACRLLIDRLVRARVSPLAGHRAVFVTDHTWSALDSLTSARIRILAGNSSLARATGLRATPTVVAISPRSTHVTLVAVGVDDVARRFTH